MEIKAEDHLGLVTLIAKPYAAGRKYSLMDSEVFSDGCLGLMNAIEAFDESLGWQFSTFATKCIRTAIHDGIKRRLLRQRFNVLIKPQTCTQHAQQLINQLLTNDLWQIRHLDASRHCL